MSIRVKVFRIIEKYFVSVKLLMFVAILKFFIRIADKWQEKMMHEKFHNPWTIKKLNISVQVAKCRWEPNIFIFPSINATSGF
jgi:hypothetical protein